MERIGKRLAAARQANGWSLREAAQRAGWTAQHQAIIESGDALPTVPRVASFTRALGLPASAMYEVMNTLVYERWWWNLPSETLGSLVAQAQVAVTGSDDAESVEQSLQDMPRHKLVELALRLVEEVRLRPDGVQMILAESDRVVQAAWSTK